ncbi:acyltransferase family protein [Streptomyces sp. ODS28]|uniref:acyltransferase family protein n=1 Tax=Streptomyces sp. ODS28 TaxID=3136688 RepID=UPI0031EB5172
MVTRRGIRQPWGESPPGRARGLDGLRALAVLAVVVFHVDPGLLPGGWIGVDVFFVISGYVITSVLDEEYRRTGRLALGAFWRRRARRLLPALLTVALAVAVLAGIFRGRLWYGLRGDLLAAVGYASNWWEVARHSSHSAGHGDPAPLLHLWSLAVEEQFYLLWPFLAWGLLAAVRARRGHRARGTAAALAALASFTAMAVLYTPLQDPSRVYFGTDTHAGGLLLGAALAFVLPLGRARRPARTGTAKRASRIADLAGAAGLCVLLVTAYALPGDSPLPYWGGLVLVSAAATAVLPAALAADGRVRRVLSFRPAVWVGRRSYAVYLWHWPLIAVIRHLRPEFAASTAGRAFLVLFPLLLASLSWRYVERPVLRHGLRGALSRIGPAFRGISRPAVGAAWTAAAVVVLGTAVFAVVLSPAYSPRERQLTEAAAQRPQEQRKFVPGAPGAPAPWLVRTTGSSALHGPAQAPGRQQAARHPAPDPGPGHGQADGDQPGRGHIGKGHAGKPQDGKPPKPAAKREPGRRVTAIGDSVLMSASDPLRDALPGVDVQARVGLQMGAVPSLLRELDRTGRLRRTVVIACGANGTFDAPVLREVREAAGPRRTLAYVTTHSPRGWQDEVNGMLKRAAAPRGGSTTLIDWHKAVARTPGRLYSDRTHPTPTGARQYARLIAGAVGRTAT